MSATMTVRCPKCGAESQPGSGFCRGCGTALAGAVAAPPRVADDEPVEVPGGKIHWGWVAIGVVMILAVQIVLGLTVTPLVVKKMVVDAHPPNVYGALAVLIAMGAMTYFLCGLLIGRLSKGYTVKEPAFASIIACVINLALAVGQGTASGGAFGAVVSCAIFGGLGALGGMLGEKLQARAQARERR
jgi:hypothetical protein